MYGYLKEHSGAFNPHEVRTLVAAFDKAWESAQASGGTFDTDATAEPARAILAKHIIALLALARSNLKTVKPQTDGV